jgi:hypothetical protein
MPRLRSTAPEHRRIGLLGRRIGRISGDRGAVLVTACRGAGDGVRRSGSGESVPDVVLHLGFHPGHQGRYHGGARRHPAPFRPVGRMQLPPRRPEMGGNDVLHRLLFSELGKVRFTSRLLQLDNVGGRNAVMPLDGSVGRESRRTPVPSRACRTQRMDRARRRPMGSPEVPGKSENVWPRHVRAQACIVSSIEREFDVRSNDRAAGRETGRRAGALGRACRRWH